MYSEVSLDDVLQPTNIIINQVRHPKIQHLVNFTGFSWVSEYFLQQHRMTYTLNKKEQW